jgi:hypothetical protein
MVVIWQRKKNQVYRSGHLIPGAGTGKSSSLAFGLVGAAVRKFLGTINKTLLKNASIFRIFAPKRQLTRTMELVRSSTTIEKVDRNDS